MDGLLKKATVNDENPTPGYVFTELAKLTHADITVCEKMADWLSDRLKKSDAAVKWKALVCVKQVAKMGRFEFRRAFQKHAEVIKANLQFRGPPDPLRGDEPYRRVREAAKDALEAIYDASAPPPMSGGGAVGSRITSISGGAPPAAASPYPPPAGGSASSSVFPPARGPAGFSTALPGQSGYDPSSPMHAPPSSSGTMVGFGNYDPRKPAAGGSFLGAIKSAFTTSTAPPPASGSPRPSAGLTSGPGGMFPPAGSITGGAPYSAPAVTSASPYPPPAASSSGPYPPPAASSTGRAPGGPGGVWADAARVSAPTGPGRRAFGAPVAAPTASSSGRVGGGASDGTYERNLVEDVTAPGGVRPVPDKDKLHSFLQAAKTLDAATVAGLLDERLALGLPGNDTTGGQGPNISHKALAVVEGIAADGSLTALKTFIADHCDLMLELYESAEKASVRTATARALHALGVEFEERKEELHAPAHAVAPVPAVAVPAASTGDILGLGAVSAPATAPAALAGGLFGSLTVGGSQAAAPTPAPAAAVTDMFASLNVAGSTPVPAAAPVAVPAPAPAPVDMFGGLMVASAPAPAPSMSAPAPAPAAAVPDIFSGLQSASTPAAPAPAPSMFAGLQTGTAPAGAPAPSPAAAPAAAPMMMAQPPAMSPASNGFMMGAGPAAMGSTGAAALPLPSPSPHLAAIQQSLMMLNQQIQTLMMQLASPALMSNPAAYQATMAQLSMLQQQQQQMTAALSGAMAAGPAVPGGFMGAMSGPMMGGAMPGAPRTLAAPAPAPAPAVPAAPPKQQDAFDFMSRELGF